MRPTDFHHDHHAKPNNNGSVCPPSLKINKESHVIKHSSSPTSSLSLLSSLTSSSSSLSSPTSFGAVGTTKPPLQRHHPVIIYTHSPKVIHTHPKDFMALVQKLTGISQSNDDDNNNNNRPPQPKQEKHNIKVIKEENNKNEDNESFSLIMDENCGSSTNVLGDGPVNSCFVPPTFVPSNPYLNNIPAFASNSTDFLCPNHQPFYGYADSLFSGTTNMRSSISPPSTFEGLMTSTNFKDF